MLRRWRISFLAGAMLLSASALSQSSPQLTTHRTNPAARSASSSTLSTRIVAYDINAKLNTAAHTIDATETLVYRNLTGQPQQTFPFHLYLNAFQPQSTFMTEVRLVGTRGTGPNAGWDDKHHGSITVSKLEVEGMGDLTGKMEFIQPDDRNANDRSVFQVTLPKPIAPGESVQFRMSFHDELPEILDRTGYKRDFYVVGQWFPKVGVWWKNAWNCHQFHANSEFFADFGTFDVNVTLPQNEIVGASGDLISSSDNSDGTKTVKFHSEDVHDFSWTASPDYSVIEDSWTGSAGPVKIHVLMSPGNMASAPRYVQALKATLAWYDKWIGPYPYDRITVVDPPHGALDAGGMEYPTLITAGTAWFMPKSILAPEAVVEHEFGHQYWYGMVATNEFEDAWLDEGINFYLEAKVMDELYGKNTSRFNFPFATASDSEVQRLRYISLPDTDPMTRFSWEFINNDAYEAVSYSKTATVLITLEKIIGQDTMRAALHEYFLRYRFKHPTGEDFLKTIEDVSHQNLKWYFDQAVYGTSILDYEIWNAHSDRLNWWEKEISGKNASDEIHRTYITVHRKGDFVFPIDIVVKFDDGSSTTEHWEGRDRWIRYTYDRKAELDSAQIDPGNQVWLDRNLFNNSYTVQEDKRAIHKLQNLWIFASECVSQFLAWVS
ncbi:MAG: M1 family metallopeptidase [Candidatus Acidiferrales bacterium]